MVWLGCYPAVVGRTLGTLGEMEGQVTFCLEPSCSGPRGPLTLFLLLLFFLLQLALFNTAQLGLADAPSLADGL